MTDIYESMKSRRNAHLFHTLSLQIHASVFHCIYEMISPVGRNHENHYKSQNVTGRFFEVPRSCESSSKLLTISCCKHFSSLGITEQNNYRLSLRKYFQHLMKMTKNKLCKNKSLQETKISCGR